MAFRPLTEAECGAPNALVQLSSHLTRDHALSEVHGSVFPGSSEQLVEQFLQETRAMPQTFRMDDLMREMQDIESQRTVLPPVPSGTSENHINDDLWALQYLESDKQFDVQEQEAMWAEISSHEHALHVEMPDNRDLWAEEFAAKLEPIDDVQESTQELLDTASDPQFQYSKFMQFMKSVGDGTYTLDENGEQEASAASWSEEYINNAESSSLAQSWPSAPGALASQDDNLFNTNFWDRLQNEWKKISEQEQHIGAEHPWLSEFSDYYDSYKEYTFTDENPMFDLLNPLQRGKAMLEEGDLPSAVLCFEAAVKIEPENAEAWQLLGISQAENEQDPNAICALKRCVDLQPDNLKALMSLAVSYTNESYPRQACIALLKWVQNNPEYAGLVPPGFELSGQVTSFIPAEHLKQMEGIFIRAAQMRPQNIDYEVQCGLGVLFHLANDYDKAVDCFKTALGVKPNDARLWNRFGATLANASKPEEAVDAYHQALIIAPGFIRARYNVGITCINLGAYKQAAEHFLMALNAQARGKDVRNGAGQSQMSDSIWSTLRMCISLMNRSDLRPAVDSRDLRLLNQAFDIND